MSYRPITDTWILARPKVPYYGAYPSGFLSRARALLGVPPDYRVLHVCGGHAKLYSLPEYGVVKGVPQAGFGENDKTLDIDPATNPDYCVDIRTQQIVDAPWPAIIADPPYTPEDSKKYAVDAMPSAKDLLKTCLDAVTPGGRVGMLHYLWPRPPEGVKPVALITVVCGYNNRARFFSVFEKP